MGGVGQGGREGHGSLGGRPPGARTPGSRRAYQCGTWLTVRWVSRLGGVEEGTVRRVRNIAPWHGAKLYPPRGACQASPCPTGGKGVPCRHDRVHDRGRALPEHLSGVAVPLGPLMGGCWLSPRRRSPKIGGGASCLEGRGGGGGLERVSPLLADLVVACSALAPLLDRSLYPNPPPEPPPPAPSGRPNLLVLVPR